MGNNLTNFLSITDENGYIQLPNLHPMVMISNDEWWEQARYQAVDLTFGPSLMITKAILDFDSIIWHIFWKKIGVEKIK